MKPIELKQLLEVLSAHGVTSYSDGVISIEMESCLLPLEEDDSAEPTAFEFSGIQVITEETS